MRRRKLMFPSGDCDVGFSGRFPSGDRDVVSVEDLYFVHNMYSDPRGLKIYIERLGGIILYMEWTLVLRVTILKGKLGKIFLLVQVLI